MLKEFREFALRGNALDMAVGLIIGAAFGAIVNSLVNDIIMPPIGMLLGNVDFSDLFVTLKSGEVTGPYLTVEEAKEAGAVTLNYGLFINTIISFTIIATSVFLVVRNFNKLREKIEGPKAVAHKECTQCCSQIPIKAKKCPHCTSEV